MNYAMTQKGKKRTDETMEEKTVLPDGEKFTVVLHPSELAREHFLLESLLLATKTERARLLTTMTLVQYVLVTKLLLMLVYKKRECSSPQMVKAFNFRKRFIWTRVCSKEKIRLFLRSKTKMAKFWERLNAFLPQVISCYVTLLPNTNKEKSGKKNDISDQGIKLRQPAEPQAADNTEEKKENKIFAHADSSASVLRMKEKGEQSAHPVADKTEEQEEKEKKD